MAVEIACVMMDGRMKTDKAQVDAVLSRILKSQP
jgi:hypothetical protein